jgi:hypothetical protein
MTETLQVAKEMRRRACRHFSAVGTNRILLEGICGIDSIAHSTYELKNASLTPHS